MRLTDQQKIDIVSDYTNDVNFNCSSLAKKYEIKRNTIYALLNRRNIKIRNERNKLSKRKYTLNEFYFDDINSEEKAYFLGFLYADGCNSEERNRISIALQEEDKYILEKLRNFIGNNSPLHLRKRRKPNWKDKYELSFGSKIISKRLAKLGCWSRKSLTLQFPNENQVPRQLIRSFILGYFDGDGSIYMPKSKKKRAAISVDIVSTLQFCESLREFLYRELKIYVPVIKANRKSNNNITSRVRIHKKSDIVKFLNWIYKDSDVYLVRKYETYKRVLQLLSKYNTQSVI